MIRQRGGEVWTDNYLSERELAAIAPMIARASGTCAEIAAHFSISRLAVLHIKQGLFAVLTDATKIVAKRRPVAERGKPAPKTGLLHVAARRKPARAMLHTQLKPPAHLRLIVDNTRAAALLNGAA
jgi:hypothetical protein